jgi:butyryl-CoA dehydrogenase
MTCFYVEKDTPGFAAPRVEHKMGIRGSPTAELAFDDVRVPDANRVGEVGDGWQDGDEDARAQSRLGIAAQAVGIAQGALDAAVAYAREREQFGKPIGTPGSSAMLADMATPDRGRAPAAVRGRGASSAATRPAAGRAMAKLFAGDTAMAVTTDAVQVLGGYGYITEYPVERMMRDAKITQLYEGTQQIQRDGQGGVVGAALGARLGLPYLSYASGDRAGRWRRAHPPHQPDRLRRAGGARRRRW